MMILRKGLQIALRHARRFKTYSIINIGGLALGFASSIALINFVSGEFAYDDFHESPQNVYRLNTVTQTPTGTEIQAAGTPLLAPALMTDIPEVEAATRLRHADDVLVEVGDKKFHETKVFFADSNFFKVLTFPLVKGNPNTALSDINTAVVTAAFAEKYFGNEDPINKTIKVDNNLVEIRGVVGAAGRSHFEFDVLISFETFSPPKNSPGILTSWQWTSFPTYVRLREGFDAISVEEKFQPFIRKYRSAEDAAKISYQLQPVRDVYLHSRNIFERDGISTKGDYSYTVALGAIAAIIMGLACFNFANISTALSFYRVRETGIRRSLGSGRSQIFFQFTLESILNAGAGMAIALAVLFTLDRAPGLEWIPLYLVLTILVGFIGGLYPAIFLSKIKPELALKSKFYSMQGHNRISFRKVIIIFQFFVTAALIAGSLSIKRQIDFIQSKDLGYNKEGIVVLHLPDQDMRRLYSSLRNKFSENISVLGVSASRDLFDGQQGTTSVEEVGSDESHSINMFRMYPNFVTTMAIEVIAGRTFHEPLTDSTAVMLNEAAVKMLGWDNDNAIGKKVYAYSQRSEVIGVVKDFNFSSLHSTIAPLILLVPKTKVEYLYVRVAPGDLPNTLSTLGSNWKSIAPHLPFDYIILDEHVNQMYRQDQRLSKLIFIFCGLSVALACLGLYGIISLMAEARAKEIGIRKVLGASIPGIVVLLSKEFGKLIVIAFVIATPAAWYGVNWWLTGYANKTDIGPGVYLVAGGIIATIAIITMSFQSIKAAIANPVKSLRSE